MKLKALVSLTILGFIGAIGFHFIALAAIDAPHNESRTIDCGKCHGQGLLQSPFWGGTMSYDQLCQYCHTESSCPEHLPNPEYPEITGPLVQTHSDSEGNKLAECRTCHDPHYQKQKYYKNTDASRLYLAWGEIQCPAPVATSCPYDSGTNTTTLQYSEINYKSESEWDALTLREKTNPCRRTILFPNLSKLGYSYLIEAIDGGSNIITVKGNAQPVYQYTAATSFAVIYGQFIKDKLYNRPVKLFDKHGRGSFGFDESFTGIDPTPDGVCQVCHTDEANPTNPTHWRADGTGADHYNNNIYEKGCIYCHSHVDGFRHGGGGGDCIECHGHDEGYEYSPGLFSQGKGTFASHSTHTENDGDDLKGPFIICSDCHDTNDYPFFKSGTDSDGDGKYNLSETDVCDTCHSPKGAFDGVNNAVIGAKNVWATGAYDINGKLRDGMENWCLGCHDDNPNTAFPTNESSYIGGVYAPNIAGDENNGNNYGFNLTGHGMGSIYATKVDCTSCHDASKTHIDGESRTYAATLDNYRDGYRLSGYMNVPHEGGAGISYRGNARLCFECHNPYEVLGSNLYDLSHTNFQEGDPEWKNLHGYHFGQGIQSDSDFDGTFDSSITCATCHNVHGAPNSAMIRHGELISTPGTTDKVPALNFTYVTAGGNDPYAALADTTGANMLYGGGGFSYNYLCNDCHSGQLYMRTPNLNPKVLDRKATPGTITQGVATVVLFTARVVDPNDNLNTVEINLSAIGGSSAQTIYDDTTHGDAIAGDDVFSFEATVPDTLLCGVYSLQVTATDLVALSSTGNIRLTVPCPGEIIVDNSEATSVGTWRAYSSPESYGDDYWFDFAGSGSRSVTWTPMIPAEGGYKVYAWWHAHTNRASDAPYTIYHTTGSSVVRIDQRINGSQWNLLGTYNFAAGTSGHVVLSNDVDGIVVADAIRFESLGGSVYELSGQITADAVGVDGITVELSGDAVGSTVTSGGGYYSFLALDGSYVVTPNSTIYDFTPTSRNVTVSGADQTGQDFTAEVSASAEIIVDNSNPQATFVGTWTLYSGYAQIYGADARYHLPGSVSDTATWTPNIPAGGSYRVYAWWHAHTNRSTSATYTINHSGGSNQVVVNQQINGGQWNQLGTFDFAAGTSGYVVLSNDVGGIVVADAIRFELVP